ncbi:hypothetical protein OKA04_21670 [Luteolibacter flavescens]|uniref:EF-hand domain-containing protein n=1 Tax=Luteolibacter flavescens TaxID=1859460 RepID=A0ABT3FVW1_9BACT|nr:hypothetical protein [Luteolibacter flavescens]MCW1887361.1 hypothetical protein [Luteolibacter flavescens]
MKTTAIALFLAALIVPSHLASAREREREDPRKEEERKKQERADKDRKRDAVKDFLKKKDKNKDSSISRDEYLADEEDKEAAGKKFDEYNKNGDRSLTKKEIEALLGL